MIVMARAQGLGWVLAAVFAVLTACGGKSDATTADTTRKAESPADDRKLTEDFHARLLREVADEYSYNEDEGMPSVEADPLKLDHKGGKRGVAVSAYKLVRKPGLAPAQHPFVALFFSTRKYERLGIGQGNNYVVMFPSPGDTLYLMVPSDLGQSISLLAYDKHLKLVHTPHQAPHAVHEMVSPARGALTAEFVFGGCVEGPCPEGHCGVTSVASRFTYRDYLKRVRRDSIR